MSDGPDAGAWYHEHFLRGSPGCLRKMQRREMGKLARGSPPDEDGGGSRPAGTAAGAAGSPASGPVGCRRVSVESVAPEGTALDSAASPPPRPAVSGPEPSSRPAVPPPLPNLWPGNNGTFGGGRCIPSTSSLATGTKQNPPEDKGRPNFIAARPATGRQISVKSIVSDGPPSPDRDAKRMLAAAAIGIKHFPPGTPPSGGPSPCSIAAVPQAPLNLLSENNRFFAGGRCVPSTIHVNQGVPFANLSPLPSKATNQKLGRRNKYATFPVKYEAEAKLAPATKHFPFDLRTLTAFVPSDSVAVRKWPTSGLEPLPFTAKSGGYKAKQRVATAATEMMRLPSGVPSSFIGLDNRVERVLTGDLEPLPFGDGLPVDDFANYIDSTIQML